MAEGWDRGYILKASNRLSLMELCSPQHVHARLLLKLQNEVTRDILKVMKAYLQTSRKVGAAEVEDIKSFPDIWTAMERNKLLSVGHYEQMKLIFNGLKHQYLVEFLEDAEDSIKELSHSPRGSSPRGSSPRGSSGTPSGGVDTVDNRLNNQQLKPEKLEENFEDIDLTEDGIQPQVAEDNIGNTDIKLKSFHTEPADVRPRSYQATDENVKDPEEFKFAEEVERENEVATHSKPKVGLASIGSFLRRKRAVHRKNMRTEKGRTSYVENCGQLPLEKLSLNTTWPRPQTTGGKPQTPRKMLGEPDNNHCTMCFYKKKRSSWASYECPKCEAMFLCKKCAKTHDTKHSLVPTSTSISDDFEKCPRHNFRKISHFCYRCHKAICIICKSVSHEDHVGEVVDIAEYANDVLEQVSKITNQSAEFIQQLESVEAKVSQMKQDISEKRDQVYDRIQQETKSAVENILSEKDNLIAQVLAVSDESEIDAFVQQVPHCKEAVQELVKIEKYRPPQVESMIELHRFVDLMKKIQTESDKLNIDVARHEQTVENFAKFSPVKFYEALTLGQLASSCSKAHQTRDVKFANMNKFFQPFSVGLVSRNIDSEIIILGRLFDDPAHESAQALFLFSKDGECVYYNMTSVFPAIQMSVADNGSLVVLRWVKPYFRLYSPQAKVIGSVDIELNPYQFAADVDTSGRIFCIHVDNSAYKNKMVVYDRRGGMKVEFDAERHLYITCVSQYSMVYTCSSTEIAQYGCLGGMWGKLATRKHGIPGITITGICCNKAAESGEVFVTGKTQGDWPVEVRVYQVMPLQADDWELKPIPLVYNGVECLKWSYCNPQISVRNRRLALLLRDVDRFYHCVISELC